MTIGQIKKLIYRGQSGPDRADWKKTILGEMVALRKTTCRLSSGEYTKAPEGRRELQRVHESSRGQARQEDLQRTLR